MYVYKKIIYIHIHIYLYMCTHIRTQVWAPNRVRYFAEPQKGNAPTDAAVPAQALRLLGSGANKLRIICEQLDTLCAALQVRGLFWRDTTDTCFFFFPRKMRVKCASCVSSSTYLALRSR